MKITIDVDCTPQELRTFFGLPHIEPMQDALVARMQERLSQSLDAMEPESLVKVWLPGGLQGLGQLQEQFWGQFMKGLGGAAGGPGKGKRPKE